MVIRILADREPYTTYMERAESRRDGPTSGSLVVLNGPAGLDEPDPDIVVLPAEEFIAFRESGRLGGRHACVEPPARSVLIPYGPVSLMERAFELGCQDYLREPWALAELRARSLRFLKRRFIAGSAAFALEGRELRHGRASVQLGEEEAAILSVLLANAAVLVPKAALASIIGRAARETDAVGHRIGTLRRKMDELAPQSGGRLVTVKNYGYRLDVSNCG